MAIVAGIDEAGYGPTLGPLVVAMSVWRVPDEAVTGDLWRTLRKCVTPKRDAKSSRVHVADSKQVYDRKSGIASLERGVLAFAVASGMSVADFAAFLRGTNAMPGGAASLPWYSQLERALPIDPQRAAFTGIAAQLQAAMDETACHCAGLRTRLVDETFFNQRVAVTRNKSAVVIEQVLSLIQEAVGFTEREPVHIVVDRLGGRAHYRTILQTAIPDREIQEREETDQCSAYCLRGGAADWEVKFTVDGDVHSLPVALASMCAKYTREVVMMAFNDFWRQYATEVKPTAGYYQDAKRFLADIQDHLPQAQLEVREFARLR